MLDTLILFFLIAWWVAAWLQWVFNGEIRQFLFCKIFPRRWLGGKDPSDVFFLSNEEFSDFLSTTSEAPYFLRGALGCPSCLSAWLATPGVVIAIIAAPPVWVIAPLLWAGGAYVGYKLYKHF